MLSPRVEEIIDPCLPIVDAHHHLWEQTGQRYLWPEFVTDARSHNVRWSVFVECRSGYRTDGPEELRVVGETEFALQQSGELSGMASREPPCLAAIVGSAELMLGHRVREVLEAHISAGRGIFRGIRRIVAWHQGNSVPYPSGTGAGMLNSEPFRLGFSCLAPLGLTFDAWLYHPQLPELTSLAKAFPDTNIVLNHFGGPLSIGQYAGRRDEVFVDWRSKILDLASLPNVFVKLGGLGMRYTNLGFHALPAPPNSEVLANAWAPYFDTCVSAFGAERCMFESNFPVDSLTYAYSTLWNAFKRLAHGASPDERHALFSGTATRFYRLKSDAAIAATALR